MSICAGDYDIIVGVVAHDREELLDVLVNHIRTIPGIDQAEFLLKLKSSRTTTSGRPAITRPSRRMSDGRSDAPERAHPATRPPQRGAHEARATTSCSACRSSAAGRRATSSASTATAGSSRTWTATATSTGSTAGRARRWAATIPSSSRPRSRASRSTAPSASRRCAWNTSGSSPRSCTRSPRRRSRKVVYDTTGSEVVENAVRIMREAAGPGRPFVITFLGSFHGGNYGTGAMGPAQRPLQPRHRAVHERLDQRPLPDLLSLPLPPRAPVLRPRLPRLHRGDDPQVQGDARQHRRRQRRVHPGRERRADTAARVAEAPVRPLPEVRLDPLQRRGTGGRGTHRQVVRDRALPGRRGRAAEPRQGHVSGGLMPIWPARWAATA